MHQVNVHEAKTHLSRLIQEALAGEEVVIARGNVPVVRLEPVARGGKRRIGLAKGSIGMREDFDAPLDDFSPWMPEAGAP